MKRKAIARLAAGLLLLILLAAPWLFRDSLYNFLSPVNPGPGEILVVEGWISGHALDRTAALIDSGGYSRVVCTGYPLEPGFLLSTNGVLEFEFESPGILLDKGDSAGAILKGTPVGGVYPEYLIVLNDSVVGRGRVSGQWARYAVKTAASMEVRSTGIYFVNDTFGGGEDRNLEILRLLLGDTLIPARSPMANRYAFSDSDRSDPTPAGHLSVAEQCAWRLEQSGIPAEHLEVLPTRSSGRERTFDAAATFLRWYNRHNLQGTPVTIVSEGIHGRRTQVLYKKALKGMSLHTGIISVESTEEETRGTGELLSELAGVCYYRFFTRRSRFLRDP